MDIVFNKLKCKVLVVGYDYRFGCMNKGDYKLLERLGKEHGVKRYSYLTSYMTAKG